AADQPDPAPAAVPDSAVPDSAVDRAGAEAEPERRHEPPPAAVAALGVGGVSEVSVPYEVPVQTVTENNGHHPAPASGPSGSSPSRRTRRVASRPAGPPVSGE
ncbi:MAG: hypothetical protein JO285_13725, partial [Kutzneria sp.]|nr:hypothetical protein [Kutzneria sp.]